MALEQAFPCFNMRKSSPYRPVSLFLFVTSLAGVSHAKTDFKVDILPLIESRCLKCHKGPHEENGKMQKPKGDIRLDGAWAFLKGNKETVPVVPKDVTKSGIIQVTTLPKDDDKFMPPEGKGDPLTPDEINKLKTWIIEGADFGGWEGNLDGKPAEAVAPAAKAPLKDREHDLLYQKLAEGLQPPTEETLKKIASGGAQIAALQVGSPLLHVDFLAGVTKCNDESLAALTPLKDNIVHLDLARTEITDAAAKSIVLMPRLTRLDLRKTKITDKGLGQLATAKNLVYLNLFGTEITDAGLASLAQIKTLRNVFLSDTKVTDAGVAKLKASLPKAEIVGNVVITAPAPKPEEMKKGKKAK